MGSFGIWHWVLVLVYVVVFGLPAVKILTRTGHSGWWALLLLIPMVNVIAYWVFAFKRWPSGN